MINRNGNITWGDWIFDYDVTDFEGLALLHGSYKGISIFHKLSLPVIRVEYDFDPQLDFKDQCQPVNDVIKWDQAWVDKGQDYLKLREIRSGTVLEIGFYMVLGAYHLYQCYYVDKGGYIFVRLWSKGLSCPKSHKQHRHHPYWRFHINVDGGGNRINYTNDFFTGFYQTEGIGTIKNDINHHWLIENTHTGNGVFIKPNITDNARADNFSKGDFYIRKYRTIEDRPWWRNERDDIAFTRHDAIDNNTDVVFWYVGHLPHDADEGEDHWHGVGPILQVYLNEA